jgi:hypothetical protein
MHPVPIPMYTIRIALAITNVGAPNTVTPPAPGNSASGAPS